jgi:hypothetical protein
MHAHAVMIRIRTLFAAVAVFPVSRLSLDPGRKSGFKKLQRSVEEVTSFLRYSF